MLTLHSIRKRFGPKEVLREISLAAHAGSFTVVTGRNGAGKTTLLRVAASILRPDGGDIRWDGHSLLAHPETCWRKVLYLGHQPGIYSSLTGFENLWFTGQLYGAGPNRDAIERALAGAGLGEDAHRAARHYSRGMLQRLALAKGWVVPQGVVLMDEPASGLDGEGRELLARLLWQWRQERRAVIVAAHEMDPTFPDGATVLRLEEGHLLPVS